MASYSARTVLIGPPATRFGSQLEGTVPPADGALDSAAGPGSRVLNLLDESLDWQPGRLPAFEASDDVGRSREPELAQRRRGDAR